MQSYKEKLISVINTLPDDKTEDELLEEFLTKIMLQRSKEQFERGEYINHNQIKKELLDG